MIADTHTGKILKTVEVTSVDWRSAWNQLAAPENSRMAAPATASP